MPHYYKSEDPTVVEMIQEYFQARKRFQEQLKLLGAALGPQATSMRDIDLLQGSGTKFELHGKAYFVFAFPISLADHQANTASGQPSWGWIEGAVEILPGEFDAARREKIGSAV